MKYVVFSNVDNCVRIFDKEQVEELLKSIKVAVLPTIRSGKMFVRTVNGVEYTIKVLKQVAA